LSTDWDAATYDRISDPQARWAAGVIERIEGAPGTILDAGCGSGRVTELLLRRFPDSFVIGIDSSAAMIEQAADRLAPFSERVTLVHSDLLADLPLDDAVDAIFSNAVFHWIGDHPRLFRNLAAVLSPGGQLVAQWGGRGNVARLLAVVVELGGPDLTGNFTTAEKSRADLEAAGFVDVRTDLSGPGRLRRARGPRAVPRDDLPAQLRGPSRICRERALRVRRCGTTRRQEHRLRPDERVGDSAPFVE
jgi:trans-aconitate 2-methyltransferase